MEFNLRRNTVWAVIEVIASGLGLFLLYKFVVRSLGVEALGIWSLVLATTSLGRFADLGASAGLGRFVAAAKARENHRQAIAYVETAIVTNLFLYAAIALIMWAPAYYGLALAMPEASLARGRELLPYSLISFALMSVTGATTGAVVGQHRSDQKSKIAIAAFTLQLIVAFLWVPRYGLPALAWAQIGQYTLTIVAGWFLFLRNHFQRWTLAVPLRWRREAFRELLGFGMKLQAVNIVSMFYEPGVKFLMSSLGGLEALGYYEMAQRVIGQLRQMVAMPNQTLVPSFAHMKESAPDHIAPMYRKALAISILCGVPLLAAAAVLSPAICFLWIGRTERLFVTFTALAAFGLGVNVIGIPAYLAGVGIGRVKWNVYGACIMTGGSLIVGYALGHAFGGVGVACASSMMMAGGSSLTMLMNCRTLAMPVMAGKEDFKAAVDQILRTIKVRK